MLVVDEGEGEEDGLTRGLVGKASVLCGSATEESTVELATRGRKTHAHDGQSLTHARTHAVMLAMLSSSMGGLCVMTWPQPHSRIVGRQAAVMAKVPRALILLIRS